MDPRRPEEEPDDFDLARFVSAQAQTFKTALAELQAGRKESHWMWFIFPQIDGLGSSSMAKRYAIKSADEARAYLRHLVLGPRLLECCRALLSLEGRTASEVMGYPDDMKLKSSMTLFAKVGGDAEFQRVLDRYFAGETDLRTVELLKQGSSQ